MINRRIAEILNEIADLLEIQEVEFKPRAYRRAAQTIESYSKDLAEIYKTGGRKALDEIPGVGKSIAEKAEEIIKTGKLAYLEKLRRKVQIKDEVMHVEGVGPKTAKQLYKKLGITTIKDLERAARKQKIRRLKGLGKKTEETILENIGFAKAGQGRMLIHAAMQDARDLIEGLKSRAEVKTVRIAGSLRRHKETIGDIDILCVSARPEMTMDFFTKLDEVKKIIAKGRTKSSVLLADGAHVDLRIVEQRSLGAALQYFTGSKAHNIETRRIAQEKRYKLNEYGLFRGKEQVAGKTEEEIYKKLGLQYVPPELREMEGELEAAKKKKIPALIERGDIRGDLQMHTKRSDGQASAEEMIRAAKALGHRYICITDHAGMLRIAHGMRGPELASYRKAVEKAAKKVGGIRVFVGAEVDIGKDGKPAIADKYLKDLDIVLGSIHSAFRQGKKTMTDRIIAAMRNDHIDIIAHPTGRRIGKRQGYDLDWKNIFKTSTDTKTLLEINGQPERLDLCGPMVRAAIEAGCTLSMGTDAHNTPSLAFIDYAVGQARRGWAAKKDIINTRSVKQVERFFGV